MSNRRYIANGTIAASTIALLLTAGCGNNSVPSAGGPSAGGPSITAPLSEAASTTRNFASTESAVRVDGASPMAAYASTVAADKPLAIYALNDLSTRMVDSSGNHLDGSYGSAVTHGAAPITSTAATTPTFPGGAYDLTTFAAAPISPLLQPAAVTLEAWVKESAVNTTGTFLPIIAYGKQSQGPSYSFDVNPQNTIRFWAKTTTGSVSCAGYTVLVPGQAYHVAASYDGSTVSVYINGRLEESLPGTGALNYQSLNQRDGLGISGSLDRGAPEFAGNISQAAVYGSALPASRIREHYIVGNQAPLLTERAANTDKFIDSIAVNVHLHYTGSLYDTQFATVKSLLVGLGVRHLRDGLIDSKWQPYYNRLNELGRAGIRATLTAQTDATPALISSYPARVPDSLEAYEAPNEMDLVYRNDPNWPQIAASFQKMLWSTVKGNAETARYRVYGPSLTSGKSMNRVGDLSQYMDAGNVHEYFAGYNPGTDGFGTHTSLGIVGSIPYNLNIEHAVAGSHPSVVTETGFNTGNIIGNVPTSVQAKYLPRLMFEMFNHGVIRSTIYELLDWAPQDTRNNFGLVSSNMQPKPAYNALKNMISALHDAAPGFQPAVLQYSIGGDVANVHHTLMQKADGSFHLALWQETRSFTPANAPDGGGSLVRNAPQQITISLPVPPHGATIEALDDNGNMTMSPATISGNTISLPVSDDLEILKIVP